MDELIREHCFLLKALSGGCLLISQSDVQYGT